MFAAGAAGCGSPALPEALEAEVHVVVVVCSEVIVIVAVSC
jgi:hypothetical protein